MKVLATVSVAACILSLAYSHMEEEDSRQEGVESRFFIGGVLLGCVLRLKHKDGFCEKIESWLNTAGEEILQANTRPRIIVNILNRQCERNRMMKLNSDPEAEKEEKFFWTQTLETVCDDCENSAQEIDASKVPANYTLVDTYSDVITVACNTTTRMDDLY
ncbi:uncharacterized protein LOC123506923 [Portunus trituberculatus]|uniref:uncharacterized protein LOC123506923 n=1 Tax=Portunus trituberculatus TaxID=210409 RepID=UPI001E1CD7A6|nr:uncharacterized protein LOC123506923 [Portunus trituberculatus]XP_045115281.1 uncharacterized protein LOC123506923 [Portunus trituberculatus]